MLRKFKSQMLQRINTCSPVYRDIPDIGQSGDDDLCAVSAVNKAISIDVRAEVSSSKTKSLFKPMIRRKRVSEAWTHPSCSLRSLANIQLKQSAGTPGLAKGWMAFGGEGKVVPGKTMNHIWSLKRWRGTAEAEKGFLQSLFLHCAGQTQLQSKGFPEG